jgi:hypothetical protein
MITLLTGLITIDFIVNHLSIDSLKLISGYKTKMNLGKESPGLILIHKIGFRETVSNKDDINLMKILRMCGLRLFGDGFYCNISPMVPKFDEAQSGFVSKFR